MKIQIIYPLKFGQMVIRTESDWNQNITAQRVLKNNHIHEFFLSSKQPYLNFKPCIQKGKDLNWSEGSNKVLIFGEEQPKNFYPRFFSGLKGKITEIKKIPSKILSKDLQVRLYLPAGYHENFLKLYPTLYLHDGKNLFFPKEAFLGQNWEINKSLDSLDFMSMIDQTIVVGIYANNREKEYTYPDYQAYGKAIVEELKPWVDQHFRTIKEPGCTAVMGSSLGGVVSFYLGWEYPHIFGNIACLSSTFAYQDNLIKRVRQESFEARRHLKIYLDSGWPGDNYEITQTMAYFLVEKGFVFGRDVLHFVFPGALHNESAWAARCHIPIQLFSSKVRRVHLSCNPL